MADQQMQTLTQNTTPALTDILLMTDDPAGTPLSQYITIQDLRGCYEIKAELWNVSPADSQTYYFGAFPTAAITTVALTRLLKVNKPLTLTRVYLLWLVTGTAGSAESNSLYIRKNNTTDVTLSTTLSLAASGSTTITGLSTAFAATDYFEVKWVTPAYATNPTGVYFTLQCLFE